MKRTGFMLLAGALMTVFVPAAPVSAFGTIGLFGQHHEHQRITRLGLAQAGFDPLTLDALAGTDHTFGAVGQPDAPWRGMVSLAKAHCDNGDYLAVKAYPHPQAAAHASLDACRTWMRDHLQQAVQDMAALETAPDADLKACHFGQATRGVKCAVLDDLGIALHVSQDFYAHSNWTDAAPGGGTISDPPGLGHTEVSAWMAAEGAAAFPDGLMTGCWLGAPEYFHCGNLSKSPRVRHANLNKDDGEIGNGIDAIGQGATPRARGNDNFRRAATVAVLDTRGKWAWFHDRVLAVYGAARGERLLCLLQRDRRDLCPQA